MKTFAEFRDSISIAPNPVYVRENADELAYDIAEDVFKPEIDVKAEREAFRAKLKELRDAALPKGWRGTK